MGSMFGSDRVIAKDFKSCTYSYVRCVTLIVLVEGMPQPLTDAIHYHTQLGLPDKVRAIKKGWLPGMWYGYDLWASTGYSEGGCKQEIGEQLL